MPDLQIHPSIAEALLTGQPTPPYRLPSERLLELLSSDPSHAFTAGQVRASASTLQQQRAIGRETSDVQAAFIGWLGEWPRREVAAAVPRPAHPMLVSAAVAQRSLTAGELAFVASLRGVPPTDVSASDAELLADLEAAAASSAERRLVGQVADPVRRHHDRLVESAGLQAVVAAHAAAPEMHATKYLPYAVSVVEDQLTVEARGALERNLATASPEARDALMDAVQTAPNRAQTAVRAAWAAVELRRLEAHTSATVRLLELGAGADPVSSQPAPRNSSAFDRGAARARAMHGDRVPSGRELEGAFGPRSATVA